MRMSFFDIFKVNQIKQQNAYLQNEVMRLNAKLCELGCQTYDEVQGKALETQKRIGQLEIDIAKLRQIEMDLTQKNQSLAESANKTETQATNAAIKLRKSKELYKAMCNCLDNFTNLEIAPMNCRMPTLDEQDAESIAPTVMLKLHSMDIKDLRKAYQENDKQIEKVLKKYASRYTTKANQAIYKLMVLALRAELQNILTALKYEKLDTAVESVKSMTEKYLAIAGEGNQTIVSTLTKFIGELEYLFINAVKIEYNYYVKKEQARQEQLAIREQMRQEAEERRALEAEKKKIEAEESKYKNEIEKVTAQLQSASDDEKALLQARILELQAQLSDVVVQKEKIASLANGRAGNVYVISNLGSFGENMFKVGMTRRLNPQDRVDELGDASVPFKFDVHSFIFSNDAVGLESRLHSILESKRVNKVNRRKEFFYTSVDELEQLVQEIEPTAEFNRTMMAEEFRQSQSTTDAYTSDYVMEDDSEDE